MIGGALTEVERWSTFAARVQLTLPFRVDVNVQPHHDDRAVMGVELHVLNRDNPIENITVLTQRPCARWTNDEDAITMLFDLLTIAMRHEIHESVRIDGVLTKDLHQKKPSK